MSTDNLEEMDQYLGRHKVSKLTQEDIENLTRPVSIKEIELIITFQNRGHQA